VDPKKKGTPESSPSPNGNVTGILSDFEQPRVP
jgi:hypothetical protein